MRARTVVLTLLIAAVLSCGLSGCGAPPEQETTSPTRAIIDQGGRTVEIPTQVDSVAMVFALPTSILLALDVGDRITGVGYTWGIQTDVEPALDTVDNIGRGLIDYEALAVVAPDLYLGRTTDGSALDEVEALGVPAVGLSLESMDEVLAAITLLGDVFGREQRAAELVAYYQAKLELARSIVEQIPADERKTAIVMGMEIGRVADSTMLQSYMLEAAGGINCAREVESLQTWPLVGTETIFAWNPDFIFCTNGGACEYEIADLALSPTWSGMTAVQNNDVYLVPTDRDSWEYPGISTCLGILWMLMKMYPDYYSEEEFLSEIDEFYDFAYGMTFELDYLGYQ